MAEHSNEQQDNWAEGMSHFREAIEHNMTASRLLTTGAIALGAAATAYFWDSGRRNAFVESGRRLSGDMMSRWSGLYSGAQGGSARAGSGPSSGNP